MTSTEIKKQLHCYIEMIEDETKKKKPNIYELLGMITEEEAEEMEKAIAETGGKIYPDDWK